MLDWLDSIPFLQPGQRWVVQVFVVVLVALVADFLLRGLVARLRRRAAATENPWDENLLDALRPPLALLIWAIGLGLAAEITAQATGSVLFQAAGPLRDVAVIAAFAWFLIRLVRGAQQIYIDRHRPDPDSALDPTTIEAVGKLLRLAILITTVIVALQTLGYSISGILAFGGIGGVAVGFAARDLLANFFGAIMLYLDRPFVVGDWVRSPDRNIEGTVEAIGWRLTRIRTFDKRPLYVPNSVFTNIVVENPSRMTNRRIYETIGVRYLDVERLPAIVEEIKSMLREHPEIDTEQTLIVNFDKFADSSLNFFVYTFTKTTQWVRYHEIKQDVLLRISAIIESHGAEIAFPSRTLYLAAQTSVPAAVPANLRGDAG